MPGSAGSQFTALEADPAWKEHRQLMDAAWAKADERLIRGLHEFQRKELSDEPFAHNLLFYPFSGPDALTATIEFPESPTFDLVALEPAGSLPSLDELQKRNLSEYLSGIRTTVASELGKSFFVTREMDRQFRGQITDGLLVPVLLLLVRTEHTVLGYKYTRLDEKGQIIDRPGNAHVDSKYANKGFAIEFREDGDKSVHRLYYISLNLDNKHLAGNTGFAQYVKTMPEHTTLLKATSYMTHHDEFSTIRGMVLDYSAAVFQDDSGIPYHFFTPDKWKVQLYGEYTKPYGSFAFLEQPDLRQAYLANGVKPLSMRLGYGFGKVASNLLLGKRLPAQSQQ
ncbi:MAG TPA: hypothetical protein VMB03_24050 [Bryobacteraceae bacterium]|nr:hypothetical protein [Bryobacteraceae bacterium]